MAECETTPAVTRESTESELFHWVCECDWNMALCGTNVSGQRVGLPNNDVICVVCDHLIHMPCPRCGMT